MHRLTFGFASVAMFCCQLVCQHTSAEERSAILLMPKSTVLYAEVRQPKQLIATIFDHPIRERIEALDVWKTATQQDGYRNFLGGRKFVELQLGMEWREALESLTSGGIFVGVDAATEGLIILVQAKDAETLELFRTKLLEISKLGQNPDKIKEAEYRGIAAYEVNKTKFAVVDDWLLITNKAETGKAMLDRMLDGGTESLVDNPEFADRHAAQTVDAAAWAFADLKALRDGGVAKKLFAGKSDNPAAELLVGGILDSLQHTPCATAQLTASHTEIDLSLAIPHQKEWVSEQREYFFGPDGSGVAAPLPTVPNTLFSLSTYRDVSEMWLRAGDLFDEKINDGFAEADANLTTLFSGKDFGEDILGALTPQVGFIATRPDFEDILPVPTIKLPQFALVMELKEPKSMTRELKRTFHSLIGFINVTGATEGRPQLELDMGKLDNGAELITSTYIPEPDDEQSTQAELLFNFSPSVGFAEERFVVSSTGGLARQLVSANANRDANRAVEPSNTQALLNADALQHVLTDNREQLISQNMLEDGNSRDEAEAAIDLLLQFVGYFEDMTIDLKNQNDRLSLDFEVRTK